MNLFPRTITAPFALALGLAVAAGAARAENIDHSTEADPEGRVEIVNVAGEIRVIGTDESVVRLRADVDRNVEEIIFERDDDLVTIRVELGRGNDNKWRGGGSADLIVEVPRASSLDVNAVSADVIVRDVHGRLSIRSVSGDITLDTASTDLDVNTMSGDLEMRGSDQTGVASLSSVSGDVVMRGMGGDIRSQSVSGDVEALLGESSRIRAESTSGNVRVIAALTPEARVDIETVSGEVEMRMTSGRAGSYTLETFSGDLENCFGPEPERRGWSMGSTLKFREGDGGPSVNMSSMSGSVRICD